MPELYLRGQTGLVLVKSREVFSANLLQKFYCLNTLPHPITTRFARASPLPLSIRGWRGAGERPEFQNLFMRKNKKPSTDTAK